jgi:ferritin-like protein
LTARSRRLTLESQFVSQLKEVSMAGASATLHESPDVLKPETIDHHRAVMSLMEELEAVDWYDQRVQAAHDDELRAILAHNRDEEKEHAMMVLDAVLDEHMRTYLFSKGSVLEIESATGSSEAGAASADGSLGIGSLRAEQP